MSDGLEQTLEEHWPPEKVVVTCDECDAEIFHSKKREMAIYRPSYMAKCISIDVVKHSKDTEHTNVSIDIHEHPTEMEKIEATITVRKA